MFKRSNEVNRLFQSLLVIYLHICVSLRVILTDLSAELRKLLHDFEVKVITKITLLTKQLGLGVADYNQIPGFSLRSIFIVCLMRCGIIEPVYQCLHDIRIFVKNVVEHYFSIVNSLKETFHNLYSSITKSRVI